MPLDLTVQRNDPTAIYQQIVEQFKERISDGRLPAGAQLPTVRQLAGDLGVTRLTIQHAYGELQSEGWIEATVGRGTFVSNAIRGHSFGQGMVAPLTPDGVINDILQVNQVVGLRSMASASPDPRLFPAEEFWSTLKELQDDLATVVSYSSSQGDPQLRVEISRDAAERDIEVAPDEILVAAGVTQGLGLIAQTLCQPGDRILVEQPTYLGLLHTLKVHGIEAIGIPLDEEGPDLAQLERIILQHRPRFFYTVPTFQNPTGRSMSMQRRRDLLALAREHDLILVEDDIYGRLSYDGPPEPTLKQLDAREQVIYVSSYSKVLMPGMRLGYVIAPPRWAEKLLTRRRAADLCSPSLLQRALAHFLRNGGLKRHLRRVLPIYRDRRNTMVNALQRHLPEAVRWGAPAGGFCCWLELPGLHQFSDLEQAALHAGWAVTPGEVFLTGQAPNKCVRVCFGTLTPEAIQAGVDVVGRVIRARLNGQNEQTLVKEDWTPLV